MIRILHGLCRSCDVCVAVCPHLALWMHGDRLTWRPDRCADCRHCVAVCPAAALQVEASPAEPSRAPR